MVDDVLRTLKQHLAFHVTRKAFLPSIQKSGLVANSAQKGFTQYRDRQDKGPLFLSIDAVTCLNFMVYANEKHMDSELLVIFLRKPFKPNLCTRVGYNRLGKSRLFISALVSFTTIFFTLGWWYRLPESEPLSFGLRFNISMCFMVMTVVAMEIHLPITRKTRSCSRSTRYQWDPNDPEGNSIMVEAPVLPPKDFCTDQRTQSGPCSGLLASALLDADDKDVKISLHQLLSEYGINIDSFTAPMWSAIRLRTRDLVRDVKANIEQSVSSGRYLNKT